GFHKIAKYYYYPGWHETGTTLETMVNRTKFQSLPEDLQEILLAGIARQNIWTLSAFESQNNFYLKKLVDEEGVSLRSFPPEVLAELKRISDQVLEAMTQGDPLSAKVYAAYRDFQTNANEWAQVSEKIFHDQLVTSS
ncbi:MAG: ABC transporter substrate-binding protein, partial [Bacteroidota bacterium]